MRRCWLQIGLRQQTQSDRSDRTARVERRASSWFDGRKGRPGTEPRAIPAEAILSLDPRSNWTTRQDWSSQVFSNGRLGVHARSRHDVQLLEIKSALDQHRDELAGRAYPLPHSLSSIAFSSRTLAWSSEPTSIFST